MNLVEMLLAFGLVCAAAFIVSSVLITTVLDRHGVRINFLLIRLLSPKYARQYKRITKRETGKTGSLFYWWAVSINLAIVSFLMALIAR